MKPLRRKFPIRRSSVRVETHYKKYREKLMEDFHNKCAYCGDDYRWRTTWFEIDHFVPQKYLTTISPHDYNNLVLACRSCNNSKSAKWPTESETIYNNGLEGFIDPCCPTYDEQFSRGNNGAVLYRTSLGRWMFHSLKLHKPQHQIIWILEELHNNIKKLQELSENEENLVIKSKIDSVLLELYKFYHKYTLKLTTPQ